MVSAKIRNNLLSSNSPVREPERDLWIAVIFQAMRDASRLHELERRHELHSKSSNKCPHHLERDLTEARKAMRWLTTPSRDLAEVCELAGFEVSSILARREQFMAGRFEWLEPLIATSE